MAEKAGVEIELTASDKASEEIGKAGKSMGDAFNPLNAVTAALNGNFGAMGQQLVRLAQRMKILHMSMMQFTLYAALVMALVKAVKTLLEHFRAANAEANAFELGTAEANLAGMKENAAEFAKEMENARKKSEDAKKIFEDNAKAINAMTRAQNEFNKAQELALATTDEERDAIERRYKAVDRANQGETDRQIRENRRRELEQERDRLTRELAESEAAQGDYLAESKRTGNLGRRAGRKSYGFWSWLTGSVGDNQEHAQGMGDLQRQNLELAEKEIERQAELKRKLAMNQHELEMNAMESETKEIEERTEEQKELNAENAAADREAAERQKQAEQDALAAERERHRLKMADLAAERDAAKANLDELTKDERAAQSRLAAAKAEVARAWGWYRDKDSMAAQLEEEKAEAAAQEQYEKDFAKLRYRRDWRTAKNLSVDQEAVRRVALAREEEDRARAAALETAENTARAADAVEKIESIISEEG